MAGNEAADYMAGKTGWIGRRIARPDIATPASIRQVFPIHTRPKHLLWDCQAVKGLTYLATAGGYSGTG